MSAFLVPIVIALVVGLVSILDAAVHNGDYLGLDGVSYDDAADLDE